MLRIGPIDSIKLVIDYYSAWFNVKGVKKNQSLHSFQYKPYSFGQKLTKNHPFHVQAMTMRKNY